VDALFIPKGAKNVEGAKAFINWMLTPEVNPAFVMGPGGGLPVLKSVAATEKFQTKFYQQAIAVGNASNCQVIWRTVTANSAASQIIMNAVYKLIKTDPAADIAAELQKAQDEFNKTVK
jgi:ABC-type glycerol-3-phosphate transport system substrate-binding protein